MGAMSQFAGLAGAIGGGGKKPQGLGGLAGTGNPGYAPPGTMGGGQGKPGMAPPGGMNPQMQPPGGAGAAVGAAQGAQQGLPPAIGTGIAQQKPTGAAGNGGSGVPGFTPKPTSLKQLLLGIRPQAQQAQQAQQQALTAQQALGQGQPQPSPSYPQQVMGAGLPDWKGQQSSVPQGVPQKKRPLGIYGGGERPGMLESLKMNLKDPGRTRWQPMQMPNVPPVAPQAGGGPRLPSQEASQSGRWSPTNPMGWLD